MRHSEESNDYGKKRMQMKIISAEFIKSAVWPSIPAVHQYCLLARSESRLWMKKSGLIPYFSAN
jgi:hypothetical protein